MRKIAPFYTDQKTADALLAVAKRHLAQPTDGAVVGADATGVTSQFQNTCQFKLTTDWKTVKGSTQNFVASGEKMATLQVGAVKRSYPTTIYAYGEQPTTGRDSMIVATRRANRWVLLPTGSTVSVPGKARLVQPKELFPACEYKSIQNVYGCELQYSDNNEHWTTALRDGRPQTADDSKNFDIVDERTVHPFHCPDSSLTPHRYWRVNLKGFSKPEDPNDPDADRGFQTYGRLWEARFWVERNTESKKTVTRKIDRDEQEKTEYTFSASVPDHWSINSREPLAVELEISPEVPDGKLFYKPSTGEWESLKTFSSTRTFVIPTEDMQITVDEETGKERYNTSFSFRVEQTANEYNPDFNEEEEENSDNPKFIPVTREMGNLSLKRPTYKLSPDDAEVAMPPLHAAVCFDSKPVPRKSQNHRYWTLTFDQPEVVTKVLLDVDQHKEHYIIAPGGRDADKNVISFIYSFDFDSEKWEATRFPEMRFPMYNMDAKIVELSDKTNQLVILSGLDNKGLSNVIQGYNFERDYIREAVEMGVGAINFAGRPALAGDPMLRTSASNGAYCKVPDDLSQSLFVIGGHVNGVHMSSGTNQTFAAVYFSVQALDLDLATAYRVGASGGSLDNNGYTGLPFGKYNYKTALDSSNAHVAKLKAQAKYVRHHNLPVRGILRRRPLLASGMVDTARPSETKPVVDFLLIGGFNEVGNEQYNKTVVSGIFGGDGQGAHSSQGANFAMSVPQWGDAISSINNGDVFLYFPPSDYVLGDCCAEYIEERDEIICFGGRANENDTAIAHDNLAVLRFTGNTAQWSYNEYPPMPHPRWSAASVLIKDLVRKGETEACDRIFIIGGRNKDGFVPEMDVLNLRYNTWETDWAGLDQGELETIPASLGGNGGTIVIQGGGNDCEAISDARVEQILQAYGF